MGEARNLRWTWQSKDSDLRNGYLAMDGRVSLADLNAWMQNYAPGVAPEEIMVNWATVVWSRPATNQELAERAEQRAAWDKRHEAWERETLAKLTAKYGGTSGA